MSLRRYISKPPPKITRADIKVAKIGRREQNHPCQKELDALLQAMFESKNDTADPRFAKKLADCLNSSHVKKKEKDELDYFLRLADRDKNK